MVRRGALLGAAAVLGVLAGCGGGGAPAPPQAPIVRATADARVQGPAIPRSFLGFSQDDAIVEAETGGPFAGVNPVLVALYRNLAASGAGVPVLRIGGNGQDSAWWNPRLRRRPRGITIDLTVPFLRSISRFLAAAHARVIFGLNLAIDRPAVAVAEARAVRSLLRPGQLVAFELGNEPDGYAQRVQGQDRTGALIHARPAGYDLAAYLPQLESHLRALRALGPLPIAAPSVCCGSWLDGLNALLARDGGALRLVSLHRYPLSACGLRPGGPGYPTPRALLSPDLLAGNVRPLARTVAVARRHGLGVRITETNSVGCAGAVGVSDRFAAALWGVNWLFALADAGVAGVNFHGSSPLYQPFATGLVGGSFRALVKPLYYAMLLFSRAVPHGSRLLPAAHAGARVRAGANVGVWATADPVDHVVRAVVVNSGPTGGPAQIAVPGASGPGTVERLTAPALLARTGVRWAGQTFATPTLDGRLTGAPIRERVVAHGHSTFRFDLPAASAAMLTVPVSAPH